MPATIAQMCERIVQNRLCPADEVVRWRDEWADKGYTPEAESFVRGLTYAGRLTPLQSYLLCNHPEHLVIGGCRLLERLGKGDLGHVYKALSPAGTVVALKILPPSRNLDPRWVDRFLREALIMRRLFHPHLARALGSGFDGGVYYAVVEYCAGESLDAWLERKPPLPPAEACEIAYQTLSGLVYLEANGLAHGNLKPSNLLLAQGGAGDTRPGNLGATVKILDTGLGPATLQDWSAKTSAELSKAGFSAAPVGFSAAPVSAGYVAPELALDPWRFDIRSDLFSLGCILYRCLTGVLPFPGENATGQLLRRNMSPAQTLPDLGIEHRSVLQEFLDRLLAGRPAGRFPTAQAALEAMEGVLLIFAGLCAD